MSVKLPTSAQHSALNNQTRIYQSGVENHHPSRPPRAYVMCLRKEKLKRKHPSKVNKVIEETSFLWKYDRNIQL